MSIQRIGQDIDRINAFNSTPGKGVTRLTFSKEHQGAMSFLMDELARLGAAVSFTPGGNLRARLKGSEPNSPAVMMGSHLDTVVQGGCFDGVVGVVVALEACSRIVEESIPHRLPVDMVVFAEEEGSRFDWGLLGSAIWTGRLSAKQAGEIRDGEGVTYPEAMGRAGIMITDLSILKPENFRAMIEVHIEQGQVLEKAGRRIGIVEVITGISQMTVTIEGVTNHAGTTPMDLRHDALQGAARIIASVEEIAMSLGKEGVATVGRVTCKPGVANVIPGLVQFTVDVRSVERMLLDSAVARVSERVSEFCSERGLRFNIAVQAEAEPIFLSKSLAAMMERKAREKGAEPLRMRSGAGHDTGILATLGEAGMIFLPSKGGRSHCPEEFTDLEDIALGAEILFNTVVELAR